jgi:hypothetical protein
MKQHAICAASMHTICALLLLSCISSAQGQMPAVRCPEPFSTVVTIPPNHKWFDKRMDAPTVFPLMYSRYEQLVDATRGYECSGVPLVALHGDIWQPGGATDDTALAYFVPKIARFTSGSVDRAINIYFVLSLVIGFISGAAGAFFWLRTRVTRLAGVIGLCVLLGLTALVGDVYMSESLIVVAVVPWTSVWWRNQRAGIGILIAVLAMAFSAAIANLTRMHAGTAVLLFFAILLAGSRLPIRQRVLIAVIAVAGYLAPVAYYHKVLIDGRDAALRGLSISYEPVVPHHPMWHNIYGGLGYLNNDYGLKVDDSVVANKVESMTPGVPYLSPEYERTARAAVFAVIKTHPRFIVETLLAKVGVLLVILLVCANIGLVSAVLYPKPATLELAFWLAFALTGANGVLVWPNPDYLLGFIAFAIFYAVMGIDFAVAHGFRALSRKALQPAGQSHEVAVEKMAARICTP